MPLYRGFLCNVGRLKTIGENIVTLFGYFTDDANQNAYYFDNSLSKRYVTKDPAP